MSDDPGAKVNDWIDVVRRAQLGPTVKLVALVIASYANADGTRVFPGVARLAVQCEVDYRTARRALAALRMAGLIEVTRRGARRSGKSDEYRLILAADLLERCHVSSPAAQRLAIERVTERHRSTGHKRPVEPPGNSSDHRSPVTRTASSTGQTAHVLQDTGDPPPSIDLYRDVQPPAEDTEVRGDVQLGEDAPAPKARDRNGGTGSGGQSGTHTRRGTERARQAQHDALNEWMRAHPEAATP